jgi:hypothetical protein
MGCGPCLRADATATVVDFSIEDSMHISFPPKSAYVPNVTGIVFPVVVDDHLRRCTVTDEALMDHFGASSSEPVHLQQVFESNRDSVQATVEYRLRTGARGDLVLRTQDF